MKSEAIRRRMRCEVARWAAVVGGVNNLMQPWIPFIILECRATSGIDDADKSRSTNQSGRSFKPTSDEMPDEIIIRI
jgi:hypothetical protein